MEWTDEAIILGTRPHGENHAVVEVFTPSAGRCVAMVHGGQSRTKQPILQAGNGVALVWRGRGEDSVGHFVMELTQARAAKLMHDRLSLMALQSLCQTLSSSLSEKQAEPRLYEATKLLLDLMEDGEVWPVIYAKWEVGLLAALGAGLQLDRCAATGQRLEEGAALGFVSPKSASAVCVEAGLPYKDRLLPLPPFLIDQGDPTKAEICASLKMTGYFLQSRIFDPAGKRLPDSRHAFLARLRNWAQR